MFSGEPKKPDTVILESIKDKHLEDLLMKYDMMSLYHILERNSITINLIWDLKDEHLKDMGLTIGQILKYNKARDEEKAKAVEGNQSILR